MRMVQEWSLAREKIGKVSKHPLAVIRELHQIEAREKGSSIRQRPWIYLDDDGNERILYRSLEFPAAKASRSTKRSQPIANDLPRNDQESINIMNHVLHVDPNYFHVLRLWAEGYSIEVQAKAWHKSKPTIYRWFEGGLAIIQSQLIIGTYR